MSNGSYNKSRSIYDKHINVVVRDGLIDWVVLGTVFHMPQNSATIPCKLYRGHKPWNVLVTIGAKNAPRDW